MEDKPRLLIVDDDEDGRVALRRCLRREWEVTTAANGLEALPLILGGGFDAVLSDVNMPMMGGHEMYLRATASDPVAARRILLMTGDPDQRSLARLRGSVRILPKPLDIPELRRVLRAVAGTA